MKKFFVILLLIISAGCKKEIEVTSIDQIPGTWRWESTCGGIQYECITASKANYATIEFTDNGKYIENHNGTMFLQTNYTITNTDNTFGTLILENPAESRPIAIMNNALLITRGELLDSYTKIK
jgi:hypothetical protein